MGQGAIIETQLDMRTDRVRHGATSSTSLHDWNYSIVFLDDAETAQILADEQLRDRILRRGAESVGVPADVALTDLV